MVLRSVLPRTAGTIWLGVFKGLLGCHVTQVGCMTCIEEEHPILHEGWYRPSYSVHPVRCCTSNMGTQAASSTACSCMSS